MHTWAILSLALLSMPQPASTETKEPHVVIDIHAPREDIRKTLLENTPVGSNIGTVMGFISNQLEVTGSVLDATLQPVKTPLLSRETKTIRVYLGQYYKRAGTVFLTAPMVVHEDVNAQWLFDRHNRLLDITVEKETRVY